MKILGKILAIWMLAASAFGAINPATQIQGFKPNLNGSGPASAVTVAGTLNASSGVVVAGPGLANDTADGTRITYSTGNAYIGAGPSDGIQFGNGGNGAGGIPANIFGGFTASGVFSASSVAAATTSTQALRADQAGAIAGNFRNLVASASGVSSVVAVTADQFVVENSAGLSKTLSTVSVSIDTAASGANGLDTGTVAANTWYATWVIWDGTTTSGLASLSATAPTMPSGYTYKARVGWVRTDGTANKFPLSFKQFGRNVQYVVSAGSNVAALPTIASGAQGNVATPTWVQVALANFVPSTASKARIVMSLGSNLGYMMAAPSNSYGAYSSATNPPPMSVGQAPTGTYDSKSFEFVLESMNVYVAGQSASNLYQIMGWEDNL